MGATMPNCDTDLMAQFMRRLQSEVAGARGLVVLDVSLILLDGEVRFWRLNDTQYEPHNAGRAEERRSLLEQIIATREGKSLDTGRQP